MERIYWTPLREGPPVPTEALEATLTKIVEDAIARVCPDPDAERLDWQTDDHITFGEWRKAIRAAILAEVTIC